MSAKKPRRLDPLQIQRMVTDWNRQCPVGSKVLVRKDDRSTVETCTRSEAWEIGGHSALVSVEGISGGYDLERVTFLALPDAVVATMPGPGRE